MPESLVKVVPTPNPDAYMFRVFETLVSSGTYEFVPGDDVSMSPLAQKLFEIDEIALILITPRFITVRKFPEMDWTPLTSGFVRRLYSSSTAQRWRYMKPPKAWTLQNEANSSKKSSHFLMKRFVRQFAQDGGDVVYHGFEDGVVKLEFHWCLWYMSFINHDLLNTAFKIYLPKKILKSSLLGPSREYKCLEKNKGMNTSLYF